MKKFLLFLLTILSISLAGCSSDDDYCGNETYRSLQLNETPNFSPLNFYVKGLKGDSFIVIRNERDFQNRVHGAQYYRNVIDWRYDELIIGQKYEERFSKIIDISTFYKESCNYNFQNILNVEIKVNKGSRYNGYITYHTIVPKTKSEQYDVITTVQFYN
ncbi:hypothetical protein HX057_01785 [Myroides odoratimimus]|nr:hypothetical protein [Myroides odoratimimus]MCA4792744.1 hypothetical protein [Myroides odoratimimus]MCA4805917.1 hypothetical protein [Myroides odoratimimus]MCA4820096.1 hypothetical protein [Myroides odoratimimus]MCO7722096.1 hypothetical protein [Myroides odoratimimus]MDM1057749.1 hypothetical protein [Myroides odoratimimus]